MSIVFNRLETSMPYDPEETWEDESDQWEEEDEDDSVDDDEEPTILCPYCRAEIWEEAEQCPECGQYISSEDRDARRKFQPLWIILAALLCLLLVAFGTLAIT